jgi:hypothetical protein
MSEELQNSDRDTADRAAVARDRVELPRYTGTELDTVVRLTRLAAATYYVILVAVAICLVVLLFWTKPHPTNFGWPSFTDICLWFVAASAGSMIVYYMTKSLWSPRRDVAQKTLALDPAAEPDVYAFVGEVCRMLNMRPPERICVSPRAEIVFTRRGGTYRGDEVGEGNDLKATALRGRAADIRSRTPKPRSGGAGEDGGLGVPAELTIGLPFFYALSAGELAALLAHELWLHADTPLTPARRHVQSICDRLQRRIESPSRFEDGIRELRISESGVANIIGATANYGFIVVRGIQKSVLRLANAAAYKAMRAWALEADVVASQIAGSRAWAGLLTRRAQLEAAARIALAEVRWMFEGDRVPLDFAAYAACRAKDPGAEDVYAEANAQLAAVGKERWDPHPPLSERLQIVIGRKDAGIVADTRPAADLLHGMQEICRDTTETYYEELFGHNAQLVMYVSVEDFREKLALHRRPLPPLDLGPGLFGRHTPLVRRIAGALLVVTSTLLLWRGADRLYYDLKRPDGSRYQIHKGEVLVFEDVGPRVIRSVAYLHKGDFVTDPYQSATHRPLFAPSNGWFYVCGGIVKRCDEVRESEFGVGNENPLPWK